MNENGDSPAALVADIKAAGMSQIDIARNLNVSPTLVTFWKQGTTNPSPENLALLRGLVDKLQSDGRQAPPRAVEEKDEPRYGEWLQDKLAELDIAPAALAEASDLHILTLNLILSGQTQNPQKGTRERIEAALERLAVAKQPEGVGPQSLHPPAAPDEELHVGIPFERDELREAPNKVGVYVVHDRRGFPTYIGSGVISSRLRAHWDRRAFADDRVAASFSYIVVQRDDSEAEVVRATAEARKWERIIIKFSGNSLLLNNALREGLDVPDVF
jgi:transcriptional regulator with XRE-family HTH domain